MVRAFAAIAFLICFAKDAPMPAPPLLLAALPARPAPDTSRLPKVDDREIIDWAGSAAADAMTFDETNYEERLQKIAGNFTPEGWKIFYSALRNAGTFDAITTQHQKVSAKVLRTPVIQQQGMAEGGSSWTVNLSLEVKYEGAQDSHTETLQLSLVIERNLDNPEQVRIAQWTAQ